MNGEWMLGLNGLVSILVGVILMLRSGVEVLAMACLISILVLILGIFQLLLGLKFNKIIFGFKN